ncbi:hypothetical protein M8J76_004226 [Diaphorina citri]|nr:hypothetical protein M8J76_004226 [Diaphorina citri]
MNDSRVLSPEKFINMRTPEIISFWGYPSEEHKVQTEDGYILTNFRMPNPGGYPIIMFHGLSVSSDCWLLRNPKEDFVFHLWKKGYDVWLWNSRGNMYSRDHVNISFSDEKFFDFTFHEIGIYDTTATIDYVLNVTGKKKVITIGHSMGTTNVLVAGSLRPEYQSKISLSILWAQAAFLGHMHMKYMIDVFYSLFVRVQNNRPAKDFFVRGRMLDLVKASSCSKGGFLNPYCLLVMEEFSGSGSNQFNQDSVTKMLDREFRPLNYGKKKNLEKYGVEKMPPYPIGNVTVPTAIYYTCCNDFLGSAKDSIILKSKLPNVIRFYEIPNKKFNHGDYLWAKDSYDLLYKDVLNLIDKYSGLKAKSRRLHGSKRHSKVKRKLHGNS